jgi:hypothetical protein
LAHFGDFEKNLQFLCYILIQQVFETPACRQINSIFGALPSDMGKQRFFIALAALCLSTSVIARSGDNPFEKAIGVDIGRDAAWTITDKTATRSGSDSGTFYHLMYDRKQLRLRITSSAEDSAATVKNYDQFAVNDVLLDGKRLPVFQWCLNNQDRHKRFLQQGLSVKKDVCKNKGEVGTFIMRLNAATLDVLKKGKKLTYDIKPYRTDVEVTFDVSDFSDVVAKMNSGSAPVTAKPKAKSAPAPVAAKTCKASPPAGFTEVKAVEYNCEDATAKAKATASVDAAVGKERESRKKLAAEREKKRLAAEQAKAADLAAKKAAEEKLAAEQAAIAASAAQQQAISSEIADKMIAVCKKKWDKGEHRCYCEKYIEHAPKSIQDSSTCSGS